MRLKYSRVVAFNWRVAVDVECWLKLKLIIYYGMHVVTSGYYYALNRARLKRVLRYRYIFAINQARVKLVLRYNNRYAHYTLVIAMICYHTINLNIKHEKMHFGVICCCA